MEVLLHTSVMHAHECAYHQQANGRSNCTTLAWVLCNPRMALMWDHCQASYSWHPQHGQSSHESTWLDSPFSSHSLCHGTLQSILTVSNSPVVFLLLLESLLSIPVLGFREGVSAQLFVSRFLMIRDWNERVSRDETSLLHLHHVLTDCSWQIVAWKPSPQYTPYT